MACKCQYDARDDIICLEMITRPRFDFKYMNREGCYLARNRLNNFHDSWSRIRDLIGIVARERTHQLYWLFFYYYKVKVIIEIY